MTSAGLAAGCAGAGVVVAGAAALVVSLRRRYAVAIVKGTSMATTYDPGERLLIRRRSPYAAGDVIVFRAPPAHSFDTDILVKRVAAVAGEPVPDDFPGIGAAIVPPGRLLVRADSPRGLDSRQMGLIEACRVVGVVRDQRPLRRPATASSAADESRAPGA